MEAEEDTGGKIRESVCVVVAGVGERVGCPEGHGEREERDCAIHWGYSNRERLGFQERI